MITFAAITILLMVSVSFFHYFAATSTAQLLSRQFQLPLGLIDYLLYLDYYLVYPANYLKGSTVTSI